MSKSKTGALIAIAIDSELKYHASTGDVIDAKLTTHILESIFFKNSPLHDGGIIIHNNRITAARCILPVSDNPDISPALGLRHRAAIGLTENSTAIVITVSEETGKISFVKDGKIEDGIDLERLKYSIEKAMEN